MDFEDYKKQRQELAELRMDQIYAWYERKAKRVDASLDEILHEYDIYNPELIGKLRDLIARSWKIGCGYAKECGLEGMSAVKDLYSFHA